MCIEKKAAIGKKLTRGHQLSRRPARNRVHRVMLIRSSCLGACCMLLDTVLHIMILYAIKQLADREPLIDLCVEYIARNPTKWSGSMMASSKAMPATMRHLQKPGSGSNHNW
eukprot:1155785-Pelagomonas_calceolata.AAC.2